MSSASSDQNAFLQEVKAKLPSNISLPDEIAEVLNISTDSAYRRIRGETELSFNELKKLCTRYDISLDAVFATSYDSVLFKSRSIDVDTFTFTDYIKSATKDLEMLGNFEKSELIYAAKDIPMYYHSLFREIAAFKLFFWQKSIFNFPKYENLDFTLDVIPDEELNAASLVWKKYVKVPCSEIWSNETINGFLRQIEFFYESGMIKDLELAKLLTRKVGEPSGRVTARSRYRVRHLHRIS